jgi:oligopeptide transport system permease protein
MIGYIARRILVAIPTLLVIITLAFFMMRFAPGGPFDLERPMPEQTRQNLLASYGMDQPVPSNISTIWSTWRNSISARR